MSERIIRPLSYDGKVTIPKELRQKHKLIDYVEIIDSDNGIFIKTH